MAKRVFAGYETKTHRVYKGGGWRTETYKVPKWKTVTTTQTTTKKRKQTSRAKPTTVATRPRAVSRPKSKAKTIPIRSYFEQRGYKVEWQGHGKPIRVYDPKTGHSANIMPGNYRLVGGKAEAPQWVAGAVKKTIGAGTYTLPKKVRGTTGQIDPGRIAGYDPDWFRKLPPEVQEKAQAERAKVGLPPAPTDRPLAYGEYGGGKVLPSYETLPQRVKDIVDAAERQAFSDAMQEVQQRLQVPPAQPLPQGAQFQQFQRPQVPYQSEIADLVGRLQEMISRPFNPEDYPGYQALEETVKRQAAKASLRALEELNARGILNSTIAAEKVAQIEQEYWIQALPLILERAYGMRQDEIRNLMALLDYYRRAAEEEYSREWEYQTWMYEQQLAQLQMAIEEQERQIKSAWERVNNLGYVDNAASAVLGLPVGTPSWEAKKTAEQMLHELQIKKMELSTQLERERMKQAGAAQRAAIQAAGKRAVSVKPERKTLKQRASDEIKRRLKAFKRPIDFAAQINREIAMGKLEPALGQEMLRILSSLYPDEESMKSTLPTWRKKAK